MWELIEMGQVCDCSPRLGSCTCSHQDCVRGLAAATRKVAAGGSGALPHVILGPESWDQRVGAGESRDGRAGTRELGPGVGTREVGPTVGTRELAPES